MTLRHANTTPNRRTCVCVCAQKFAADDDDGGGSSDGDNHKSGKSKADLPKKQFIRFKKTVGDSIRLIRLFHTICES